MNKKFSTLFAAFLVASSSFSIFAQNAVPAWYKTGADTYKADFEDPTADELKEAAKFDLLNRGALKYITEQTVNYWNYILPLQDVNAGTLIPGVFVAFDSAAGNVAGGQYVSGDELYSNVNQPQYGVITQGDITYLGVRATETRQSRVEFTFDTRGLSDATSFHFYISRLKNDDVNRNLVWKIASAKAYKLDGTDAQDLPYNEKYQNGFLVDKEGVTVDGVINPDAYKVMFNMANTGEVDIDNSIVHIVLESELSEPDENATDNTLEPVTLFSSVNLDFIRPHVEIDYEAEKEFRVGVNRSTECEASEMDVKIWKFNDKMAGVETPHHVQATYLKLNVKAPIVLEKIGNVAVTEGNFSQATEADGSRSFYVRAGLFNEYNPVDWSNVKVVYHVEPGTVKDQWELADYVFATTTASSTDTAFVRHSVDARGSFKFGDDLVFTKYEEVLETSIDFTYLPKFILDCAEGPGPAPANAVRMAIDNSCDGGALNLELLTPADPGSTDRWEDKIEFLGFNWYFEGELVDGLKHTKCIPNAAIDCLGNLNEGWTVKAAFHFASGNMNIDQDGAYNIEEKWGLSATLNTQDDCEGYSGQDLINLGEAYYPGVLTTSARTQHVWTNWRGIETDKGVVGSVTGTLANIMNISAGLISAAQDCECPVGEAVKGGAEVFAAPYFTNKDSYVWGIGGSSRNHVVHVYATGLKPDADDANYTTIRLYKQAMRIGEAKVKQDKNFYFSTEYANAVWNRGDVGGLEPQPGSVWRGESAGDTLYIRVPYKQANLDDLKNNGIPVKVRYTPQSRTDWVPTEEILTDMAQFGLLTNDSGDGKATHEDWEKELTGFNQFNVVGTVFKGLISTLTGDKPVGAYTSFLGNIQNLDQFEWGEYDSNVFRDLYTKNYGTYYLGQDQCYEVKDGTFVIAGLNLVAPVTVEASKSNKIGAFDHDTTVVIGTLDGGKLIPNKYGELLAYVKSTFKPSDKAGIVPDTIHSAVDNKDFIYNYVNDTVRLYPMQIKDQISWTYVYGLDEKYAYKEVENNNGQSNGYISLFDIYGAYRNDTVAANIYGDVKQPELYFATTADTKAAKLAKLDFGAVTFIDADIAATKEIYLIGKDLPSIDPTEEVSKVIAISPAGALIASTEGKNQAEYVSEAIIPVSVDLLADKSDHDLVADVLAASTLCNCTVDLPVNYSPVLAAPVVDTKYLSDNINGSKAEFRWSAVPGAHYYKVELGQYEKQNTSKNIFISEVKAEEGTIMVELFNGTGEVINPLLHHNYKLTIMKNGAEYKTIDVISTNTQLNEAYKAEAFSVDADLSPANTYTVLLKEGGKQIDIFEFTNTTRLSRDEKDGLEENTGAFNKNDWNPDFGSLPVASYMEESDKWDFLFVQGIESEEVGPTSTSIRAINLQPKTEYAVRVTAYSYSPSIVKSASSDIAEFGTSIFTEPVTGDMQFDEDSYSPPVGNEDITVDGFNVFGGVGSVTIQGAANKTVVVTNVLGQTIARTVLSSDNATISAPAGIVVVAVEGESAVKTVVK
ncbi:DUF6383 domain-containing protein [Parabacteroides goldsteinii]|uniref:DUF6383 domain-containing protein n=1 Tax=Parabacteroides goldsteinii TaxID=328812 RepID=UPI00256F0006|nr:DUF6383 domain-containing protein [Parabacteroides goldsteinii]